MRSLEYLKLANQLNTDALADKPKVRVNVVTNFTDKTLIQLLTGVLIHENINPDIFVVPYHQYPLFLKNSTSELYSRNPDITFVFFDINQYLESPLQSEDEFFGTLKDIESMGRNSSSIVVMNLFALPYESAYGNLTEHHGLFERIKKYNQAILNLAKEIKGFYAFDLNRLMHRTGERHARDFRGMYAFDIPFTMDFFLDVAKEWGNYVLASTGRSRKCLVLDLDNTLWGGVLGEAGIEGIALGPNYPGRAFMNFQRVILEYFNRGVILAINSRNNESDVKELFVKHPHMILKPEHFAAMSINWNNKADNLIALSKELNIGLDSMVFLDDDAMNRDLVREQLPMVLTPDFSLEPEQYVQALLSLPVFTPFNLTAEDIEKGKMYAEERQRNEVKQNFEGSSFEDYVKQLEIKIDIEINNESEIPRVAQLTTKTNQFNLSTKRYGEKDIEGFVKSGSIITATVSDRFGKYGLTAAAILLPSNKEQVVLDTFLMSCRILGRGIEKSFFNIVLSKAKEDGFKSILIPFVKSPKNDPAKTFIESLGLEVQEKAGDDCVYIVNLMEYNADIK